MGWNLEIWGLVSAAKSFISELQNEPKHEVNSSEGVIISELKLALSNMINVVYANEKWRLFLKYFWDVLQQKFLEGC